MKPLKKTIFNKLDHRYVMGKLVANTGRGICLSLILLMMPLYADVLDKLSEKNDKVALNTSIAKDPWPQSEVDNKRVQNKKGDNRLEYHALFAEQWEIARSGESILSLPVLNKMVNAWLKDRQKMIEIQYPGGEEGELWVHELADWLVSLGIPSDHMIIVPGSGADDVISFVLVKS